jgi:hypothetical protein
MIPHSTNDRHHFSDKVSYRARFVLSGRFFQRVGAFKPIRTGNLHLPPVWIVAATPSVSVLISARTTKSVRHLGEATNSCLTAANWAEYPP